MSRKTLSRKVLTTDVLCIGGGIAGLMAAIRAAERGCRVTIVEKGGQCADACPSDVFYNTVRGEIPSVTYPDECWHCNACVEECPHEGAIRLRIALPLPIVYKGRPACSLRCSAGLREPFQHPPFGEEDRNELS